MSQCGGFPVNDCTFNETLCFIIIVGFIGGCKTSVVT